MMRKQMKLSEIRRTLHHPDNSDWLFTTVLAIKLWNNSVDINFFKFWTKQLPFYLQIIPNGIPFGKWKGEAIN